MAHQQRLPRYTHTYIDTCAFDPNGEEEKCSRRLLELSENGNLILEVAHSVLKKIDHPSTPRDVKALARSLIYTIDAKSTPKLEKQREVLRSIVRGNARIGKHEDDADHLFDLYKHGGGYFITTDNRLLSLADLLFSKYFITTIRPCEYEILYYKSA